jgi:hypothetical protein
VIYEVNSGTASSVFQKCCIDKDSMRGRGRGRMTTGFKN